ncbi:transcriptional regulator FtrA [Thalassospira sp. CH_XMU1448-2]|uniref:transcriptional regulator FtrA n=1 Tax=Thalassospira sp. CH_XMU1448-2 TaxID=3107773 RepID=UPI0030086E2D
MTQSPQHPDNPAPDDRHHVVVLAYDGLCTFEFGIALEAFALPRPEFDFPWYRCSIAGIDPHIRAMGGFSVAVDAGIELLEKADTIIIPGWRGADAIPDPVLISAIQRAHARGCRIVTICSGVFVLAHAGILQNGRATTHWRYVDKFRAMFADTEIVDDVLYVDHDRIVTSAGSSAGIDACLHVIRSDHGAQVANTVARRLVMPPHRDGGQAQYIEAPIQERPGKSIAVVLDWARENLAEPIEIGDLARQSGLSQRTFLRRFRDGTGLSPLKWLRRERINRSMKLLEETDLALVDIAEQCGFQSLETFRIAFRDITGTPPASYRNRFKLRQSA